MAPILKEVESPASNTATSSPAPPQSKPASEAPARPQPVALEIPVTINGARTVDGSDKRVPFSESTQTVLVFPHGAVIRIATPLTSGQLVFLTNEKTKKEVVCQVVKSKSSGGAGAYVELQFTEPSLAFWGLQIPGASPATSAPRPVAPISKPPIPSAPAKPPVASKSVAPAAVSVPEVKSVPPAPPVAVTPPAPVNVVPAAPKVVAPSVVAPSEASKPASAAEIPSKSVPDSPAPHTPASPLPPLRDYSKQIDALFAVPQAPAPPAAPSAPVTPSTDNLKLQAARLQEQLGSLLFTEKASAPPAAPSSATLVTPEMMANDLSAKLADLIQGGPSAADSKVPKGATPVSKPAATPLGAEEEVKIPSWLGSVENAEVVVDSKPSATVVEHGASATSEGSLASFVADESSQSPAFAGQILGDSAQATPAASKTGLFAGLAAAALLIAGGGAWYYHQSHSDASSAVATTYTSSNQPARATPSASNPPQSSVVASSSTPSSLNSSPASSSRPSTNAPPIAVPPAANAVSQPKTLKPTPKDDEPQVEAPAKSSSLGKVHLAAPVVNHSDAPSQSDSDAFASIDTKGAPASGDPLGADSHNGPAAPLPVGGAVKQAQLLKSVAPEYPVFAKAQHISGRVQIEAVVDTAGNVAAVKALSGPALLHQAALDAVKKWKYSPAVLDGQPTITHVIVNVDFRNQ